ncbi:hypothetical protein BDN71DRAFT_1510156 [Pleurotus eryngii]|uniref:Uncharacterized protein n=1 Tax=Pleurotus eryngii TaxID=5323 RepID=A0A9P6DDS5_PLEER|nr:hypothetical protein BDN71DRAFT_1510156 [Pleurotus eryngii]
MPAWPRVIRLLRLVSVSVSLRSHEDVWDVEPSSPSTRLLVTSREKQETEISNGGSRTGDTFGYDAIGNEFQDDRQLDEAKRPDLEIGNQGKKKLQFVPRTGDLRSTSLFALCSLLFALFSLPPPPRRLSFSTRRRECTFRRSTSRRYAHEDERKEGFEN